jgi:hypothetical protein
MNLVRTRSPTWRRAGLRVFRRRDGGTWTYPLTWGAWRRISNDAATVLDALRIENTAQDVVAHTGKVFHTAATDQDHRVFLQVVAFTGDVADDLVAVGQAHLGDLPHGRVRLLRRRGVDARADATLLRAALQVLGLGAFHFGLPRLADQLLDRWHTVSPACSLMSSAAHARSTKTPKPHASLPYLEDAAVDVSEDRGTRIKRPGS